MAIAAIARGLSSRASTVGRYLYQRAFVLTRYARAGGHPGHISMGVALLKKINVSRLGGDLGSRFAGNDAVGWQRLEN
jgi:hypothetical protein